MRPLLYAADAPATRPPSCLTQPNLTGICRYAYSQLHSNHLSAAALAMLPVFVPCARKSLHWGIRCCSGRMGVVECGQIPYKPSTGKEGDQKDWLTLDPE